MKLRKKGIRPVRYASHRTEWGIEMELLLIILGIIMGSLISAASFPKEKELLKYVGNCFRNRRYIAVEACYTTILFILYKKYTFSLAMLFYGFLFLLLVLSCIKDFEKRIIPDPIVIAVILGGICFSAVSKNIIFIDAITGSIVTVFIFWFVSFVTKGGIGMGDVKLFAGTALYMGLEKSMSAIAVSTLISGLYSIILVLINPENREKTIPFAPFILMGTLAALVV